MCTLCFEYVFGCFGSCAEQSCVGRLRLSFSRKCDSVFVIERSERGGKSERRSVASCVFDSEISACASMRSA